MGKRIGVGFLALVCAMAILSAADAKVEKMTFGSGGSKRTAYLYVPVSAASGKAPLLLLLHGSGHDGRSLVDPWLPLAKSEGIVLVAPDASDPRAWRIPEEGPDLFRDLIDVVRRAHEGLTDDRRMYVFGHSAGAIHGLDLGILESQYFAAVAVHAGVVSPEMQPLIGQAPRKIPMAIWVGTTDPYFPLDAVRRTRDTLTGQGFDVKLTEIPNHTHDYYSSAAATNKEVWAFLKGQKLTADPQFQQYQFSKRATAGLRG